jgi:hypothetical protein
MPATLAERQGTTRLTATASIRAIAAARGIAADDGSIRLPSLALHAAGGG